MLLPIVASSLSLWISHWVCLKKAVFVCYKSLNWSSLELFSYWAESPRITKHYAISWANTISIENKNVEVIEKKIVGDAQQVYTSALLMTTLYQHTIACKHHIIYVYVCLIIILYHSRSQLHCKFISIERNWNERVRACVYVWNGQCIKHWSQPITFDSIASNKFISTYKSIILREWLIFDSLHFQSSEIKLNR